MKTLYTLLFVILTCLFQCPMIADWPCRTDSAVPVSANPGNQWNVHLIADGSHGSILVWQDRRAGNEDKVYCQRIDGAGNPVWAPGGIPIAVTGGYQYYPQALSDGSGGAYIAWQDNRYGVDYDIFIQHISSAGVPLWFTNGTLVCNASGHQYNPQLVSDGTGGVIVVWQDKRGGNFDIYAQRYSLAGAALWPGNGQLICSAAADQVEPKLVSDTQGGAIIAWTDYRAGTGFTDIYAQRILANGARAWKTDGVPVCLATNTQWNVRLVADGIGGAIVVWQDRRLGTYDNIYAQRIDNIGQAKWSENGLPLAQVSGVQYYPQVASDASGGAIVVWQDNRRGSDYDIYGQRVTRAGQLLWPIAGQPICVANGHQYNPQIVTQGGFAIVTWQDRRTPDYNIYAQRLNFSGAGQWDPDGTPVSTIPMDQFAPQLATDDALGAIIGWPDYHHSLNSTDIYALRLGANGKPAGGCYRTFTQTGFSFKPVRVYSRFTHETKMPNEGNVRDSIFGRGAYTQGIVIGLEQLDAPRQYGWEYFTRPYYIRKALPQNGTSRPLDRIFNRPLYGALKNPSVYRYNNRLSGEMLTLKLNVAASDVRITDPNLGEIIFKDALNPSNPLNGKSLRAISSFVDSAMTFWRQYNSDPTFFPLLGYWLGSINSAFAGMMDTLSTNPLRVKHTNALFSVPFLQANSEPPPFIPAFQPTPDIDELPSHFELYQNYPNPFNPVTTIEFVLPNPAIVTLKIYNMLGQEVASLLDRITMDEGRQIMDFDGTELSTGVYFYQLSAEEVDGGRVSTGAKKMILIK